MLDASQLMDGNAGSSYSSANATAGPGASHLYGGGDGSARGALSMGIDESGRIVVMSPSPSQASLSQFQQQQQQQMAYIRSMRSPTPPRASAATTSGSGSGSPAQAKAAARTRAGSAGKRPVFRYVSPTPGIVPPSNGSAMNGHSHGHGHGHNQSMSSTAANAGSRYGYTAAFAGSSPLRSGKQQLAEYRPRFREDVQGSGSGSGRSRVQKRGGAGEGVRGAGAAPERYLRHTTASASRFVAAAGLPPSPASMARLSAAAHVPPPSTLPSGSGSGIGGVLEDAPLRAVPRGADRSVSPVLIEKLSLAALANSALAARASR
jgi:hypothetical protein